MEKDGALFDKLPNGEAEKASQFKKIFPNGIPAQEPYNFTTLVQAISAATSDDIDITLRKEDNGSALCKALEEFRKAFTDLSANEMFFNPKHLIKAYELYDQQFNNWSWGQRDLFWRQVIGFTQRFVPTCIAQAFCQGLYYIVNEKQPLTRELRFKYNPGSYYPLGERAGLGFDLGIRWVGGWLVWWRGGWADGGWGVRRAFEKLCRANTSELLRLDRDIQRVGQIVTDNDTLTSCARCTIS